MQKESAPQNDYVRRKRSVIEIGMSERLYNASNFSWEDHEKFLTKERMRPMFDRAFGQCFKEDLGAAFSVRKDLKEEFYSEFHRWLIGGNLNKISGLDSFHYRDYIVGVTQYLDDLHITQGSRLVCLEKEYLYHKRMKPDFSYRKVEELKRGDVLILGAPFCFYGDLHPRTNEILDLCLRLDIPVHIDAAWFGCMRDFVFNYDHPAVQSVAFSLSKGLGLGSHRVGVRYSRFRHAGPVTIMNDFGMEVVSTIQAGMIFIKKFGSDYLQGRYFGAYNLTCEKYKLKPTKAIHVALKKEPDGSWQPRGVRAFLRYFVDDLNEFN